MTTTGGSPKFLEHADDGTRILNKRRQLFDIKERYIAEKAEYDKKCKILEQREADLKRRDLEFQAKLVRYKALINEKQIKQQKLAQRLVEEERRCQELDNEAATLKELIRDKQQHLKTPEV